jgi:ABC-type Fe3+/spermidine/putrescine transport system ATPase subunit
MRVPTIFVTHDLEEAVAVSRQIAIVVDGGIRQIGIAREVLDHPNDARVAELTQARNLIRGRIHQSERGSIADTPMGEIPLPAAERSLTDGTSVIVVIRPEVFRVAPPSDAVDGDLAFSGSVTGVIDLGTRAIVSVQVAAATVEVALSPSDVHRYELTEGGPVRLTVQHRDLHVIAVDAPNDSWKL